MSRAAEECLFECAEFLSEGGLRQRGTAQASYFGSTMMTVDLERLGSRLRGALDDAARAQLVRLVEGSVRVRLRLMRLALSEAIRRVPDRSLGTAQVETRVRLDKSTLYLDTDIELPLRVVDGQRRARS